MLCRISHWYEFESYWFAVVAFFSYRNLKNALFANEKRKKTWFAYYTCKLTSDFNFENDCQETIWLTKPFDHSEMIYFVFFFCFQHCHSQNMLLPCVITERMILYYFQPIEISRITIFLITRPIHEQTNQKTTHTFLITQMRDNICTEKEK